MNDSTRFEHRYGAHVDGPLVVWSVTRSCCGAPVTEAEIEDFLALEVADRLAEAVERAEALVRYINDRPVLIKDLVSMFKWYRPTEIAFDPDGSGPRSIEDGTREMHAALAAYRRIREGREG